MPDEIELVAPGGCDEANHGLVRYRVDNSGRLRVPLEAAHWFIKAGFRPAPVVPETAPPEAGDGAATQPAARGRQSPPSPEEAV